MIEREYFLGLSVFPGIGPKRFAILLGELGSAKNIWEASVADLKNIIGEKLALQFDIFKKDFDIGFYTKKLAQQRVTYITIEDKNYPSLLKKTTEPPFILYIAGDPTILFSQKALTVVGTRKITDYGMHVTKLLTSQLVEQNFVIVSGLAIGVDTVAHKTAIDCQGKTIAVLGCGVNICTPAENRGLYDIIQKKSGCIVSTFPLDQASFKGLFPARNSTIAGLSLGVLVTEGAQDSGALITAAKAKEFGRPVFSVPGPITSDLSKGTNKLLQEGAHAIVDIDGILEVLSIQKQAKTVAALSQNLSKEETEIVLLLKNGPLHFDQIVAKMGKDARNLGILLGLMEVKGIINQEGKLYRL